ncbi:DCTN1 [Lepeophtheirus salmonis]|uniref:DCTN1 n=1 Tax=Lepeophtheirus salmonis TaxID=72036 RepID=A0A7R8H4Q1_LEPSM|nr:DCTN1 [Lepeophtheirus salmonis]CAF2852300.1 DCTN1 [Lepeophtheirus salmonis]
MSELSETMEMATLDKEMAEEKAETLQIELEHAKERIEELTLDLDIIKTEFGTDGSNNVSSSSGITNFEFKQLTAQNEKLRETLVRMRDLSAHEKNEITKYTKEMEEMRSEMATYLKENEKSKSSNEEMRQTIVDLQDQVDAALGSEEMVDNLTVKCLDLEDKVSALIEEKEDLETLHDMNEELQENARETEIELREELDLVQAKIRDIKKEREAAYEIINDHETTIRKFRDLVGKVQEQNTELRGALERETNKPVDSGSGAFVAAEMMDFKKMFAETKAHSKAIDMELRQCEADQSNKHVMYLTSFMSDSFMGKGGDNEAVLVLLLIPRLIWKVRILSSQVKDKFCPSSQPTIDRDSILKGHTVERYSFGLKMTSLLHTFTVHLGKFESALNTCSPATFLRIGTLFPEMSDQLDENVPTDNLNKSLNYFENIYPLYLSEEKVTDGNYLLAISKAYSNASEALSAQISIGKALLAKGQDDSQIGVFFKTMEGEINETVKVIKSMKRRIPEDSLTSIVFPGSYGIKFDKVLKKLACLVNAYFQFGKTASVEAGSSDPENGISPVKLLEILSNSVSSEESLDEDITGDALSVLKKVFDFCSKSIQELNKPFQDGEWDVNSNSEPRNKFIPPVELRSQIYKTQLKEAESIKYKLENKDLDIKELKKHLKVKGDELSEMQVRKDLADKKLFDSSRDSELMIEKLQRKLDDVCCLLRRKEKEFEDTMDQLQSDIESLESEKGELKDRVKNMSKKALIEGISKSQALTASKMDDNGPNSMGPSVPSPIKDSPMLLQQIEDLRSAVITLKEMSYVRQGEDLRHRMLKLKPIILPKKKHHFEEEYVEEKKDLSKDDIENNLEQQKTITAADNSITDLVKRVKNLRNEVNSALLSPMEVIDLQAKPYTCEKTQLLHLAERRIREKKLRRAVEELSLRVAKLTASRYPGGEVSTDLNVTFPSLQMAKVLNEKGYTKFGRLKIAPQGDSNKTVPVLLDVQDLKLLHNKVLSA